MGATLPLPLSTSLSSCGTVSLESLWQPSVGMWEQCIKWPGQQTAECFAVARRTAHSSCGTCVQGSWRLICLDTQMRFIQLTGVQTDRGWALEARTISSRCGTTENFEY
eukprot:Mycagemm_TRINITY_DN10359_c1_g1::TRINITY_DN10359_c1_g1_i1::g.679::m.679 type:complete len:109 gc:universal TRINITY_DN10359_c1_g1_i1:435-109(-)